MSILSAFLTAQWFESRHLGKRKESLLCLLCFREEASCDSGLPWMERGNEEMLFQGSLYRELGMQQQYYVALATNPHAVSLCLVLGLKKLDQNVSQSHLKRISSHLISFFEALIRNDKLHITPLLLLSLTDSSGALSVSLITPTFQLFFERSFSS